MKKKMVFCQLWEESERGWGVRPDGYSLHLDQSSYNSYILSVYKGRDPNNVPDEYTRIFDDPFLVEVSEAVYRKLRRTKSLREWSNKHPKRVA